MFSLQNIRTPRGRVPRNLHILDDLRRAVLRGVSGDGVALAASALPQPRVTARSKTSVGRQIKSFRFSYPNRDVSFTC